LGRLVLPRLQLDAVLLGQDAGERERREVAVVDDDLAKQPAAARLLGESLLELLLGQELLGDEQLAELPPRELKCCCLHALFIGRKGLITQAVTANDHPHRCPEYLQVVTHERETAEVAQAVDIAEVEIREAQARALRDLRRAREAGT